MDVLGHPFIDFVRGSGMDAGEGGPRRSLLFSTVSILTYTYRVFSVSSLASLMCLHDVLLPSPTDTSVSHQETESHQLSR